MLALTVRVDPSAGFGRRLFVGLRDALEAHPGDVPVVVRVGDRRLLLLGAVYTVDPCLDLEAQLRELRLELEPDQEVPPWRT